ncbi:CFEM domain-containing protein [Microdochium nivale]|nr:CFEM domain-containing protein [Microdochium nivale]
MRLSGILVLLCAMLDIALAQLPPGTPSCAIPCYLKSALASTCGTNVTCFCTDQQFIVAVETCVTTSCRIEDVLVVKNSSSTACGFPVQNIATMYTVTSTVLTVFAIVLVTIRAIYRQFVTDLGLGPDDWTIIAVALGCIPCTVLNYRLAEYGIGRDIWTLTPHQITNFGITFYFITIVYLTKFAILKLSIMFFYLRIFPDIHFRRLAWLTIGFIVMYGLAFDLAAALQCLPISYNWTKWNDTQQSGRCSSAPAIAWSHAAVNIALDLWMLALPLWQVRTLNIHWKKKIGIGAMFVVGTFVTIVSIIRLASIIKFSSSSNLTFDYTQITLWSTVEVATGVMCACMPTMRLILVRAWPKIFGTPSTTAPYNASGKSWGHTGNTGSQPNQSRNRSANRSGRHNIWKPKFAKGSGTSEGVFGGGGGRHKRIGSNDDVTELQPSKPQPAYRTESAPSEHGSHHDDDQLYKIAIQTNIEIRNEPR